MGFSTFEGIDTPLRARDQRSVLSAVTMAIRPAAYPARSRRTAAVALTLAMRRMSAGSKKEVVSTVDSRWLPLHNLVRHTAPNGQIIPRPHRCTRNSITPKNFHKAIKQLTRHKFLSLAMNRPLTALGHPRPSPLLLHSRSHRPNPTTEFQDVSHSRTSIERSRRTKTQDLVLDNTPPCLGISAIGDWTTALSNCL